MSIKKAEKEKKAPEKPETILMRLVDDMGDSAFQRYRSAMAPSLGFRILKPSDIRKIDVQEKLSVLSVLWRFNGLCKEKSPESVYADLAYGVLSACVEEKGRNLQYYSAAEECVKKVHSQQDTMNALETLTMIYFSQMRAVAGREEKKSKKCEIGYTEYCCKAEDNSVLNFVQSKVKSTETSISVLGKTVLSQKNMTTEEKKYLFYFSGLMLYRVLELEGEI